MLWRVLKNGIVTGAMAGKDDGELGHLLRADLFSIIFGVLRDHSIDTVSKEDIEDSGTTDMRTPVRVVLSSQESSLSHCYSSALGVYMVYCGENIRCDSTSTRLSKF